MSEQHKHVVTVSLTESYEELAVTSSLVRRQGEDARHVISIWRLFLLKQRELGGGVDISMFPSLRNHTPAFVNR